jgi:integrase/recombinase XerD
LWEYAVGLDMPHDLQAAASEYIGWLQLEANRSPNTVRAYKAELNKLFAFLAESGHTNQLADLRHEDLRAYQRRLAERLKSPASRARALVAIRSWLRWLAKEGISEKDLSNGITLPKLEQRLPKPIDSDELARLLAALPSSTQLEKRDRALVQFLISTGCRISEALALDRTDFPRTGNRLIVTGKGSKQRAVYLTTDARSALEEYLISREDASMALFVNYDRAAAAATTLLEVTGGDVRLVQEVLGHANLNTLQGYTKIVDSRKQEAYRRYQEFLDGKKKAAP